ncbi:hypothetical protein [Synechococcus sp. PCC 7336]|uniref:hypothetical protein n=1 Tax=Synechococcus sp. PCC 7336 TaxID=195250 RepID=UPI000346CC47|nr:hypothetical protein [Synechococcus sp. PCC 7336]
MFQRSLTLGIVAAVLMVLPVRANEASRALLEQAVVRQDWDYAIGMVDRIAEEEGPTLSLLEYRVHLELLRAHAELDRREEDLDRREAQLAQQEQQLQTQNSTDLARLEFQASIQERRDRLEERQERRNRQRLQLAEEDFLRALTLESRSRAGAFSRSGFPFRRCFGLSCSRFRSF